jgi:hypothetical protein
MGRTVADVALLTSVMSGQHPVDHASWGANGQMISLEGGVQGLRIGLATRLGDFPVSRAVVHNTHAVATALESAGALEGLARLEPRVYRCFEAGAVATGCELTIEPESKRSAEFRTDEGLLDAYIRRAAEIGRRFSGGADALMNRASTDMGNVPQVIPAIHPYIGIDSLPAVNHQPEFAAAAASSAADRAVIGGATALALTLFDAATDSATRDRLILERL